MTWKREHMTQLHQVKNCISIFGGSKINSWGSGRHSDAFAFCVTICLTRYLQSCELVVSGIGPLFEISAERQEAVSTAESIEPLLPISLTVLGAISTSY